MSRAIFALFAIASAEMTTSFDLNRLLVNRTVNPECGRDAVLDGRTSMRRTASSRVLR
jgi:hypothetical protein